MLPADVFAIVMEVTRLEREQYIKEAPKNRCLESSQRVAPQLASRGITAHIISSSFLVDSWVVEKAGSRRRVSWVVSGHCWVYLPDYEVMVDCTGDQFNDQILNDQEHVPSVLISKPHLQPRYLFDPNGTPYYKHERRKNDRIERSNVPAGSLLVGAGVG